MSLSLQQNTAPLFVGMKINDIENAYPADTEAAPKPVTACYVLCTTGLLTVLSLTFICGLHLVSMLLPRISKIM